MRLLSIPHHEWLQQYAEQKRMIDQLWRVLIFLLRFIRAERWCGRCCFIKSPWSSELTLAPARCPHREVTTCSNTHQRCTELPKHTTTSCWFGCAHHCLELGKTPNFLMRKVIFFFVFSAERNDQTEQEERREIKQRLTRKVKSCNTCYQLLEIEQNYCINQPQRLLLYRTSFNMHPPQQCLTAVSGNMNYRHTYLISAR